VFPLVIRAGGGSARDSLSILDQLLAGAGPEGVTYRSAVALLGVTDAALLDEVVPGRDVVISALSPRGDMAGKVEGVLQELVRRVDGTPTRVAHVGGASSLLVEEGGPRLWDLTQDHVPADVKPEVETGLQILDDFR